MNMQEEINTPQDFYRKMLSSVTRALSIQRDTQLNHLAPGEVSRSDVDVFLDEVSQSGLNIVFMVDEFDRVLRGRFDVSFLEGIRAWQGRTNVAWIFASHNRLETIGEQVGVPAGSPYYNIFVPPPIVLGSLTMEEAKQLILHPTNDSQVDFSLMEVEEIIGIAGRMPYSLQNAAALAYQGRFAGLDLDEIGIRDQLLRSLDSYYTHIWEKQITESERQLLEKILRSESISSSSLMHTQLEFLGASGLLEPNHGQMSISGEVLKTWITRRLQQPHALRTTARGRKKRE
jgi:hypothetical protein